MCICCNWFKHISWRTENGFNKAKITTLFPRSVVIEVRYFSVHCTVVYKSF